MILIGRYLSPFVPREKETTMILIGRYLSLFVRRAGTVLEHAPVLRHRAPKDDVHGVPVY